MSEVLLCFQVDSRFLSTTREMICNRFSITYSKSFAYTMTNRLHTHTIIDLQRIYNIEHSSIKYIPRPTNRYLFIYIRGKAQAGLDLVVSDIYKQSRQSLCGWWRRHDEWLLLRRKHSQFSESNRSRQQLGNVSTLRFSALKSFN